MLDRITWFRQSALLWQDGERRIYVDPWGTPEDAAPADVILDHARARRPPATR